MRLEVLRVPGIRTVAALLLTCIAVSSLLSSHA